MSPTREKTSLGCNDSSRNIGAHGMSDDTAFSHADTLEKGSPPADTNFPCIEGLSGNADERTPITHLYLTFESDLPSPPTPRSQDATIPPPPDLTAFTSPLTWSESKKRLSLALGCTSTFLTAYLAGSYSPPSKLMADDFDTSQTVVLVGITTFCLGFSFVPMVLAPVSEIWGRYPVFIASGFVWVCFQTACALVDNAAGMLVCRFFVGGGASVFSSVFGGVLADLWRKEDRNTAMSLFSGAVLMGTGSGPLVTAGMVDIMRGPGSRVWRWTFWHQVILDGALLLALTFLFKETRAPVLLSRKAKKLNAWYEALEKEGVYGVLVRDEDLDTERVRRSESSCSSGGRDNATGARTGAASRVPPNSASSSGRSLRRIRWKVQADEERAALSTIMATSVGRAFYMLVTEPVVFWFALWAAFAWGVLYLSFSVVSYLHLDNFEAAYKSYVAMVAGSAVAAATGIWQERLLRHPQWRTRTTPTDGSSPDGAYTDSKFWAFMRRKFPADAPEARLYFACITSLLLPAGLFGAFMASETAASADRRFGGAGGNSDDVQGDTGTALALGMGFATWGIYAVYLATFNYLADAYHIYASSALAGNSFCRNVLGGSFPIATAPMFRNLGVRGAGGMLGGVALGLTAVPWVLVFYGASIRSRSKMAQMLQK